MLLCLPDVLDAATVAAFRDALDTAEWIDGRATAGVQSGGVKRNEQLPEDGPLARALGSPSMPPAATGWWAFRSFPTMTPLTSAT